MNEISAQIHYLLLDLLVAHLQYARSPPGPLLYTINLHAQTPSWPLSSLTITVHLHYLLWVLFFTTPLPPHLKPFCIHILNTPPLPPQHNGIFVLFTYLLFLFLSRSLHQRIAFFFVTPALHFSFSLSLSHSSLSTLKRHFSVSTIIIYTVLFRLDHRHFSHPQHIPSLSPQHHIPFFPYLIITIP